MKASYDPRFAESLIAFDKRRRKKLKWRADIGEMMQFQPGEFVAIEHGILYHIKPDGYTMLMGVGKEGGGKQYEDRIHGFGDSYDTPNNLATGIALAKHSLQMFADKVDDAVKAARKGK